MKMNEILQAVLIYSRWHGQDNKVFPPMYVQLYQYNKPCSMHARRHYIIYIVSTA